jgi:hypothetical protein
MYDICMRVCIYIYVRARAEHKFQNLIIKDIINRYNQ